MTIFANVYVGAEPNDNTGDPLRNAFEIINQNFANIVTVNLTSPVQTVANRTGNIVLSINDVSGAVGIGYINSLVSSANTAATLYTMGNYQNWTSNVSTISSALDQLAARLTAAGF
jgi:hypothetical protein